MARRTGAPRQRSALKETTEVWEVGRRLLAVEVAELAAKGEQPEVFAALQNTPQPGMVRVDMLTSSAPLKALAEFVVRAMQQPHAGPPRRPALIRVSSAAEVELLSAHPGLAGIPCEVAPDLPMLEELYDHLLSSFGHFPRDYRAQAKRLGETLGEDMLLALFRSARAFFRRALWETYDDSVLFELTVEPAQKPATKAYGTLMGSMGETFGLVLFPSLEDLRQLYERPEPEPAPQRGRGAKGGAAQRQEEELHEVQQMIQAMQAPSISLTYAEEDEVPEALWEEAQALQLPLAYPDAFPVVMRTGQGRMQVASATELVLMCVALQAILEWDRDRLYAEGEAIDQTFTTHLPAVAKTTPAITVHTTLRPNPFAPEVEEEEDDDDDAEMPPEFVQFFEKLTASMPEPPPEPRQVNPRPSSRPRRGNQ